MSKYELLFWKMVARNKKIKMESEQKMQDVRTI